VFFHSISFLDPGPHGSGRYSVEMLPEIEQRDFRKGAQVHIFTLLLYYSSECLLPQSLLGASYILGLEAFF
jgi:hypothetical protein